MNALALPLVIKKTTTSFFFALLLFGVLPLSSNAQLDPSFYKNTCPNVSSIVREVIRNVSKTDTRMLASLVRLHFHDCFVQGCDASVLLNTTDTIVTEQDAFPNINSLRGLDVVNKIKTAVEAVCPNTVSCADILALAAELSSTLSQGPDWKVPLGRRDSLTANQSLANQNLPAPFNSLDQLKAAFAKQGLNTTDLVALSGAHTFGRAHCSLFVSRLYNFSNTGNPDPTLNTTYLQQLRKINGVTGSESNPISTSDPNSNRVQFNDQSIYVDPDPGHSIQDIYEQIFGETWSKASETKKLPPMMEGFAQNATRQEKPKEKMTLTMTEAVMNGFKPNLVPVYKELVKEFAICDSWFASVPASTQPNRLYVHSATSHGLTSNDPYKLIGGLPQKTIFDSLDENGFNFGIYYQQPPSTLFYRNLRQLKYIDNFHEYGLTFKKHCEEGKLPNYVVIEQRFFDLFSIPANDDHPSHDVGEGQKFVKEVYEALRGSPQWNEMLFVITYDEHGGFYDHVQTPVDGVPSPDDTVGPEPFKFKFDRLGVRVPTIFISPWIEPGKVLHEPSGPFPTSQYEHSSIPATVKKIFNLPKFLTKRDAWAGTFESLLTLTSPRTDCPEKLPNPIKLRERAAKERAKLSEFQEELVLMAATLNGDHRKSIYPEKLVGNMCVSDAVKYVEDAFNMFLNECEKAKKNGADGSEIVDCANSCSTPPNSKNFSHKMLSCVTCDR